MSIDLPNALLRTFVAVVESGSMIRASEQVFISQSAISFQIKKLEGFVDEALFRRDGKRLILTASGQTLYRYAKRILSLHDEAVNLIKGHSKSEPIKVGMVQDFSEKFLRNVLTAFADASPDAQVYVKICRTTQLKRLISEGELDLAVGFSDVEDDFAIGTSQAYWFGDEHLMDHSIVPLALLERPCRFRDAAITTLERSGRAYRIVVEAPNLSALRAAVDAGIGLTCRTILFGNPLAFVTANGLESLPKVGCALFEGRNPPPAAKRFAAIVREALPL